MKKILILMTCFLGLHMANLRADPLGDILKESLKEMLQESGSESDQEMVENFRNAREREKRRQACTDQCINNLRASLGPGERARCQDRPSCSECWSVCGENSR